ncbi:major facilitator superfamily transporter [Botrytis cinerea]
MADPIDEKHQYTDSDDIKKKSQDLERNVTLGEGELQDPIFKHADPNDGDEALKAFAGHDGEVIVMTPEMEKKLLRKIDWNLMPVCLLSDDPHALCCVWAQLSRQDHTFLCEHYGMKTSLDLKGDNYQWLGSMFYIGYLVWDLGGTLCCMAATSNFAGAVAVRFFLGVFEAAVTPGFTLFTSQWYTQKEQGLRTGIWFSFNGFAQIFGGLVAYGISVGVKKHGSTIASWKIVFLAIGLLTVAIGCIFLYFMPDNQLNAKFLTPQERLMAVERIRKNQQGVGNKHFKMYQLKEALADPVTWAFVFYGLVADIPNGGISNFFSQLIVSFGYTPDESLLYGTPGGAVEVIALILCGYLGDKYGHRLLISISGLLIAMLGMILIVALPLSNDSGRLAGYYLTQASPTPFTALLSMISSNVAGNIIGPQVFRPSDAPRYKPAEITIIVCYGVCALDVAFISWYYNRMNKKNEAIRAAPGYKKLDKQEFLDLTDKENHEFVYAL